MDGGRERRGEEGEKRVGEWREEERDKGVGG